MKNTTTQQMHDDEDQPIEWTESERLSNQRLWWPILGLRGDGDDFYPPADSPELDKYLG